MHVTLSDLLELCGVLIIVAAATAVDVRLGLAVIGVALVVVGFLLDSGEDDEGLVQ